jgi:hypothetical protein
VACSATEYLKP